jgi:hypothetical protein
MKVTKLRSQVLAERGIQTTADLKKTLLDAIQAAAAGRMTQKECNAIAKCAGHLLKIFETGMVGIKQMHIAAVATHALRRKAASK